MIRCEQKQVYLELLEINEIKLQAPGGLIIVTECSYLQHIFGMPVNVLYICVSNVTNSGKIKTHNRNATVMPPGRSGSSMQLHMLYSTVHNIKILQFKKGPTFKTVHV